MLFFHGFSSENYSCSIVLLCPGTTGQHPFGVVEVDATAESKGRIWQKWCEKGDAGNDPILRNSSKVGQAVDGALLSRLVEFADMAQRREYAQVGFNPGNHRDCTTDERNVLRIERSILTLGRHEKFHSTNVAYLVFAWKHRLTSVRCIESTWFLALWHVSGQRCVCKHYHRKGVRSSVCGFRQFVAWNVSVEEVIFHAAISKLLQRYSYIRYFLNKFVVMFRWHQPPKDSLRRECFPRTWHSPLDLGEQRAHWGQGCSLRTSQMW